MLPAPLRPFAIALGIILCADLLISFTPLSAYLDARVENLLSYKLEQLSHDRPDAIDVLFLGTSRTNNGFATPVFEETFQGKTNAYNMGLPNCDYKLLAGVLQDLVKHGEKPRHVFIEVAEFLFQEAPISDNSVLYYRTLISRQPDRFAAILTSRDYSLSEKKEVFLSFVSGLYRYRSVLGARTLLKMLRNQLRGTVNNEEVLQGWHGMPRQSLMDDEKLMKEKALEVAGSHQAHQRYSAEGLERLIAYCKDNGIGVTLVQWPTHPIYQNLFEAEKKEEQALSQAQQFRSALRTALSQYPDVAFVNFEKTEPYDSTAVYSEPSHLNQEGAVIYTKLLAEKTRRQFVHDKASN